MFKKGKQVTGIPLIVLEKLSQLEAPKLSEDRLHGIMKICTRAAFSGSALMKHNRQVVYLLLCFFV